MEITTRHIIIDMWLKQRHTKVLQVTARVCAALASVVKLQYIFFSRGRGNPGYPDFCVIAPSKARRILQGESPCREEISNDLCKD